MDFSTLAGFLFGGGILIFGLTQENLLSTFINTHGILLVFGGTLAATLVNTPSPMIGRALNALWHAVFPEPLPDGGEIVKELVRMAEGMHRDGITGLRLNQAVKGDDFLAFAVRAAQENHSFPWACNASP